jgi:hypothetical protein
MLSVEMRLALAGCSRSGWQLITKAHRQSEVRQAAFSKGGRKEKIKT